MKISLTLAVLVSLLGGSWSLAETSPVGQRFKKLILVVLENTDYSSAVRQPNLAQMIKDGARMTNFSAENHPSQGNYIAMIAGDPLGVRHDRKVDLTQNHLGDLLESKGLDWRVYAEDYPGACYTGMSSGRYVRRHNPFISFLNVSTNPGRCRKIQNASAFDADLATGRLPAFSMYIPNLDNDGHDTNVEFAGKWLQKRFGGLLSNPAQMKDILFVLTFDESESTGANHILTILLGGSVIPGSTSSQELNHAGLLRLVEEEFSLGSLGRQDKTSPSILGIWR